MEEARLFCPKCGTSSLADAVYCAKCGTKLQLLSEILRQTESADVAKEPELVTPPPMTERVPVTFGGPPSVLLKREVPVEGGLDEKFLNGYSSGPGCLLYFLNRVFFPYFLLSFVVAFLARGCESLGDATSASGDDSNAAFLYLVGCVLQIGWLIFLLRFGSRVRRIRWLRVRRFGTNESAWRSFSHFRADEIAWNVVGIIGWILVALGFVFPLAAGFIEGFTEPY